MFWAKPDERMTPAPSPRFELAVVKAIEGPDYLYVVQRAWRLPAGKADALLADSRGQREAAEAFLAQVRLCNPAVDRSACPAAYPR